MVKLIDVIELSKQICQFSIKGKLAYASTENLVGRVLNGYHPDISHICLLTPDAAQALCGVQNLLTEKYQLGLFLYDGFRPLRAVKDFVKWAREPISHQDHVLQKKYYPTLQKNELFAHGYIAEDSGHSYGNTIDLVLIDKNDKLLDMGTIFDFMDEKSHLTATAEQIGKTAVVNRNILTEAMRQFEFEPYVKEYWHFSHRGIHGREVQEPLDFEILTASY